MADTSAVGISPRDRFHAVTASFLGWTLDAFDFFVVVFMYDTLAAQFHVTLQQDVKNWLALGVTKTAMVYRLNGNEPQSHE